MPSIKSVITPTQDIDVNKVFRHYKYAVAECPPIRLSDGRWMHVYSVTKYNGYEPTGDEDEEMQAVAENY